MFFLVKVDDNFELAYEALDAIQPDMQQQKLAHALLRAHKIWTKNNIMQNNR